MVLTTNKLKNQEGNLKKPDGTSKIYNAYPPDYPGLSKADNSQCNKPAGNPCPPNAVLMGWTEPSSWFATEYQRCGCLNNGSFTWTCQPMKYANGAYAYPVSAINNKSPDSMPSPTFQGCDGDPPNYATCSTYSTYLTENGFYPTCSYPDNAIPSYEQAVSLYGAGLFTPSEDEKALLYNYCFTKATDSTKCMSPLTNCPNAFSNDGSSVKNKVICDTLKKLEPQVYEDRMLAYCSDLYNKNKDNPDLSILQKSGCQCLIDTTIKPDPVLSPLMTNVALGKPAHCIWQPCLSTSGNYVLKDDLSKTCASNISCLNLVEISGNASVGGTINQNLSCQKASCNPPCKTDQKCDEAKGVCINLSQTTTPPTPPTPPTTTTFDILAFIKQQPLPVIIGGGSIIGVIIIIILYFMFANKPSQQTKL